MPATRRDRKAGFPRSGDGPSHAIARSPTEVAAMRGRRPSRFDSKRGESGPIARPTSHRAAPDARRLNHSLTKILLIGSDYCRLRAALRFVRIGNARASQAAGLGWPAVGAEFSLEVRLLKQVLYFSSAVHLFSDDELLELLKVARANNARLDITGMLLYADGNFVQLIEGPDNAVDALYAKISRDPRHTSLLKALDVPITERRFADWTLGFDRIAGSKTEGIDGLTDFLQKANQTGPEEKPAGEDAASRLLDTFKRVVRTDFGGGRR